MQALTLKNLRKTYPNGVEALKGIDLEVKAGDFFALLGPNGAGKSTTIGIVSSLVNKTSGSIKIFDHDLDKSREKAKLCIGLVPQEFNFNIFETVEQILLNQAGYYGVPYKEAKKRAEIYSKKLGLWEKLSSKGITLSGGMKRRLMIARALMHHPKLLILDEPTAGVDIEIRRSMWEFLRELNQKGITIILTTHYLEEAETLCKNIAIIDHGDIIQNTSMKQLLKKLDTETFILYLNEPISEPMILKDFSTRLLDENTLEVDVKKDQTLNNLFETLKKHKIGIASMRNKVNRLEELFLFLTAKK